MNWNEPTNLEERFDLVWCFEVAEHVHQSYVGGFFATLTNHADRIVLSAARPGQGGLGHLNEQPPDCWIGRMKERGFALSHETDKYRELPDHFAENILIFERIDGPR